MKAVSLKFFLLFLILINSAHAGLERVGDHHIGHRTLHLVVDAGLGPVD